MTGWSESPERASEREAVLTSIPRILDGPPMVPARG
jgi:hypothetical protein